MPTPKHIVEKLVETVRDPRTNAIGSAVPGLRKAMAAIMGGGWGEDQSGHEGRDGSKEGFAFAQASRRRAMILVPNGLSIHAFGFVWRAPRYGTSRRRALSSFCAGLSGRCVMRCRRRLQLS
jgi:alanine-synthesizing transaminase